jgi:hypothetical protein
MHLQTLEALTFSTLEACFSVLIGHACEGVIIHGLGRYV